MKHLKTVVIHDDLPTDLRNADIQKDVKVLKVPGFEAFYFALLHK